MDTPSAGTQSRLLRLVLVTVTSVGISVTGFADNGFPPAPAPGHLRIVAWNIQHYAWGRTAPRTTEQWQQVAARMVSFDAAVFCLQEMVDKSELEQLVTFMGPSYDVWYGSGCPNAGCINALVYDQSKVELLETELWDFLVDPPYSTFHQDYPHLGGVELPFYDGERALAAGVFQAVDRNSKPFRAISCHFNSHSELAKIYEGRATNMYVGELLNSETEVLYMFLAGDLNAGPNGDPPPHWQLQKDGILQRLPDENGRLWIDFIYVTETARSLVPSGTSFLTMAVDWGEDSWSFQDTYSDHTPVFVDFVPEEAPPPSATSVISSGSSWLEEGDSLSLNATVSNARGSVQYQWLKNDQEIPGAESSTLAFETVTFQDTGVYVVRITDESAEKTVLFSNPINIQVFESGLLPLLSSFGFGVLLGLILLGGVIFARRITRTT